MAVGAEQEGFWERLAGRAEAEKGDLVEAGQQERKPAAEKAELAWLAAACGEAFERGGYKLVAGKVPGFFLSLAE